MRSGLLYFERMSLSLAAPAEAEVDRLFNALAADGAAQMPIGPTFFSPHFGAVTGEFDVTWMMIA